jgi:hypothetical protein
MIFLTYKPAFPINTTNAVRAFMSAKILNVVRGFSRAGFCGVYPALHNSENMAGLKTRTTLWRRFSGAKYLDLTGPAFYTPRIKFGGVKHGKKLSDGH